MNTKAREELAALAATAPGGLLKPEAIVDWAAANPQSALYQEFTWDNDEAARKQRISEARNLIRVWVITLPNKPRKIRCRISVPTDRTLGGGYRDTQAVLNNPVQRTAMLHGALQEIRNLKNRFNYLEEMKPLFREIEDAVDRFEDAIGSQNNEG